MPPGDDAAVLDDALTVTTDALIEGVHFDDRCSATSVGFKSIAVSVSDLASMGARPTWATLSIAVPRERLEWVTAFAQGLHEALAQWSITLIGGDTTGSPGPIMISVTLAGRCVSTPLTRDQAKPGDDIWVTGALGLAGQGWQSDTPSSAASEAWTRPQPPLAFALALARAHLAHAAMDLSDGLGQDLPRLCQASGVGAEIDGASIPASDDLPAPRTRHQLFGGEDYQLLFTASPDSRAAIAGLGRAEDTVVTRIGTITDADILLDGAPWPLGGWSHFAESSA